jgi:hypothetical protein
MEDAVHIPDRPPAGLEVPDISLNEFDIPDELRHILPFTGKEIVQDPDPLSAMHQSVGDMGSDKAGSPGN